MGFKATMPHIFAGILKLPAISLPIPNGVPPAATIAPSPPDDPPGVLKICYTIMNNEFLKPKTNSHIHTRDSNPVPLD